MEDYYKDPDNIIRDRERYLGMPGLTPDFAKQIACTIRDRSGPFDRLGLLISGLKMTDDQSDHIMNLFFKSKFRELADHLKLILKQKGYNDGHIEKCICHLSLPSVQ